MRLRDLTDEERDLIIFRFLVRELIEKGPDVIDLGIIQTCQRVKELTEEINYNVLEPHETIWRRPTLHEVREDFKKKPSDRRFGCSSLVWTLNTDRAANRNSVYVVDMSNGQERVLGSGLIKAYLIR